MRFAFSTLGCPGWPLARIVGEAGRLGFAGVELRGLEGELDLRRSPDFAPGRVAWTRDLFERAGIPVVSLDSSARLISDDPGKEHAAMREAEDYVALAAAIGAPLVRVFGGFIPEGVAFEDAALRLAERLSELGDRARAVGVAVAIETHDGFLTGEALAEVMRLTDHEAVGVLWDVGNCHFSGEPVERTARLLGRHLRLVHVKDAVRDGDEARLTFLGEGEVPLREALRALSAQGYAGFLSYEWEKVWQPDLPEPEEAFPQYVAKMKEYLDG